MKKTSCPQLLTEALREFRTSSARSGLKVSLKAVPRMTEHFKVEDGAGGGLKSVSGMSFSEILFLNCG